MLTGRFSRCRTPQERQIFLAQILLLGLLAGGAPQGCSNKTPTLTPTPSASAVSPTASPTAVPTAGSVTAVPPPPALPVPHPTRDEMRQMRLQLDAPSGMAPADAVRIAVAIGDLGRAEAILRPLVTISQNDTGLRYRLAEILRLQMKLPEARQIYLNLSHEDPRNAIPYLALSDMERLDKKSAAAWAYLAKGISANQTGAEALPNLVLLARRYSLWGDKKTAEKVLRQALGILPDAPQVMLELAGVYRNADSRKMLVSILQRDPQNLDAKRQLASLLADHPDGPEDQSLSGRLLVDVFRSGQPLAEDYLTAAKLAEREQDWAEAAQAYVTVLTMDPERATARYHLARVYSRLGQTAYAREESALYNRLRDEQEQRGKLARVRSSAPRSAAAHFAEAHFAEKTQDYRVAVIAYGLAAQFSPDDPKIRQARAKLYAFLGWKSPAS